MDGSRIVADIGYMSLKANGIRQQFQVSGPQGVSIHVEALMSDSSGPVVTGGGVTMPAELDGSSGPASEPLHVHLTMDGEAQRRGEAAHAMIIDAVRDCAKSGTRPPSWAVQDLGRLVDRFAPIAWRTSEFRDYLGWLEERRLDDVIERILGERLRGRRRVDYFYLVAIVDRVRMREQCSVAKAAAIVERRFGRQLNMTAAAIRNQYSRFHDLYHVASGGQYLPASAFD